MSLTEKEKVYEKSLDNLHYLSIGELDLENTDEVLENLEVTIKEWVLLLGSNSLSKALKRIIKNLNASRSSKDYESQIKTLSTMDIVLSPLEHYMIGLEELKRKSFRGVVIRCGMVCERIVNRLLYQLNAKGLLETGKFNDKIGWLQNQLSGRGIIFAEDFCSRLSGIYNIRNRRGPHDVPCADEIEAKDCVASMPLCYSRYLSIIESFGFDLDQIKDDMTNFVNDIVRLGTPLPAPEGTGKVPRIVDVLVNLYGQGFFSTPKELKDVKNRMKQLGYDFRVSSIQNSLNSLCVKKGILRRSGTKGKYKYSQKIPPEVYFDKS